MSSVRLSSEVFMSASYQEGWNDHQTQTYYREQGWCDLRYIIGTRAHVLWVQGWKDADEYGYTNLLGGL